MLTFRSRAANLVPVYDADGDRIEDCYVVKYKGSCPLWQGLEVGDLVLIDNDDPRMPRVSTRVVEVMSGSNGVKLNPFSSNQGPLSQLEKDDLESEVIKNLSPVEYYLSMLGIYIHQLFFRNGDQGIGLPDIIYNFLQTKYSGSSNANRPYFTGSDDIPVPDARKRRTSEIDKTFEYLAMLYAWLVCRDYRQGSTPDYNRVRERNSLSKTVNPMNNIARLISDVVTFEPRAENSQLGNEPEDVYTLITSSLDIEKFDDYDWGLRGDSPEYVATLDVFLDKIYTGRPRSRKSGIKLKLPFRKVNEKAPGKPWSKGTRGLGRKLRRPRPPRIT
jgi:hypothetical protein